ncbi:MAG: C40 family peptidase [Pseudonocardia sp.]|nr:C40 family peptidase [Pseudonocardia sp.]
MHQHTPTPAFRRSLGLTVAATTAAALTALLPATPAVAAPAVPTSARVELAVAVATPASVSRAMAEPAVQVSAARRTSAMAEALSKIGSPYRWGAAGPNAFDCSGLVSWSYKKVGVSLPRSSAAMSRVGTPVAKSELRPGDLVFFYRPVSHVAIYIGDGKVVHASTAGQPVKISELNRMPFNSARRI